jgi:RHS repeat-associated protein
MGNPTSYRGYTMTWRGKQLAGFTNGTKTVSFKYNEDGLRQQKTYNDVVTDYFYNGSVLIGMQRGTAKERFSYDAAGNVVSVNHNGTEYYYLRNAQGDIVKIIDASGNTVVEYTYDTWVKKVQTTGSLAGSLGLVQPFRYRGYVYDWETGLYYLQSRYYDPEVGRFISADVLLSTGQGVLGHNAYAYCLGNPVGMRDDGGTAANRNNTVIMADGRSGKMIKRVTPVYDPPIRISYFSEGQEQEAIDAFRSGSIVYYRGARLWHNIFTKSSFTLPENIFLHDTQLSPETLRHEYGHVVQARILGHKKYLKYIATPSVAGFIASEVSEDYKKIYFSQPWERGADYYGGVENRDGGYLDGSLEAWKAYELWIILFG